MVKYRDGFFLIEIMIGLSISIFFILIITHYIIEVKVSQQKALKYAEKFLLLRNNKEKDLAKKHGGIHA